MTSLGQSLWSGGQSLWSGGHRAYSYAVDTILGPVGASLGNNAAASGGNRIVDIAQNRMQPLLQQYQQLQDLGQRFTTFVTPPVKNALRALHVLLTLPDTSSIPERTLAKDQVIVTLMKLYEAAPPQMNDQDTNTIIDLVLNISGLDLNHTTLDALKMACRGMHATVLAVFNAQYGHAQQFADNLADNLFDQAEQRIPGIIAASIDAGAAQAERRFQPYLQQVQDLSSSFTSFTTPEIRNAHRELGTLLSLDDTASAHIRQASKERVIEYLFQLLNNAPVQMTDQEKQSAQDLMVFLIITDVNQWNAIQQQARPVHAIVLAIFNTLYGPLEHVITGSVQTAINTATNSIREMITPLLPSPVLPPVNPVNPPEGGNPGNQTVSAAVGMVQQAFNTFVSHAGDALSKQAARSIALVLHTIYTFVLNNLRGNNDAQRQAAIEHIRPNIDRMQRAQNEGSWTELTASIRDCFAAFQQYHIYFSQISFGNSSYSSSVVPELYELGRSLEDTPVKVSNRITPQMIQQKSKLVEHRTASYAGIEFVQKLGFSCSESFRSQLLKPDGNTPLPQLFRTRVFAHINSSNANFLKKTLAKWGFVLVQKITSSITCSVIDTIQSDFSKWQKKDIDTKGKDVLNEAIKYFSDVSGIYTCVAQTPANEQTATFLLLEKAVQSPSRNQGMPSEKFYHTFMMSALKLVHFNWTKKIGEYFDVNLIPTSSKFSFVKPILDTMTFFCKKTAQAIIFVPQSIVNLALQGFAWIFFKTVKIAPLIDTHINAMRNVRSPAAFALQEGLVYAKLKTITNLVRKHLKENGGQLDYIPPDQELQCQILMESLLEVLHKSRKHTVDDLRHYVQGDRTTIEKVQRELESYVIPQVKQPIAMTFWTALHEALSDESLLETQYDILSIVDRMFDEQAPITDAQFHAVDKGISEYVNELIYLLIGQVIDEKLDVNNTRKQEEITKYTRAFKKSTKDFKDNLERENTLIASPTTPDQNRATAIRAMNEVCEKFIFERLEALGKAKGNLFLRGIQGELDEKTAQLKNKVQPISEKVKEMKDLQKQIDAHGIAADSFLQARSAVNTLVFSLCNTSLLPHNFSDAERDAQTLNTHITRLLSSAPEESQALIPLRNQLTVHVENVKRLHKNISILYTIESQWNAFIALKQLHVAENTPNIIHAYRNLAELIQQLPNPGPLLDSLKDCYTCSQAAMIQGTFPAFIQARAQALASAETNMRAVQTEITQVREQMDFHFTGEVRARRLTAEKRQALLVKNTALQSDLRALGEWEAGVQDTTVLTIDFMDFMKWVQGTIHSLAMAQAKSYVEEFREMLLQPHFFSMLLRYGIRISIQK